MAKKSASRSNKDAQTKQTGRKDAVDLIKEDHKRVEKVLDQLARARATRRKMELFDKAETQLLVHARLEEDIFYPAFRDKAASKKDDRLMYYEAREEHDAVERLLAVMHESDMDSEQFEAQAKLLKEQVVHHAKEEEEKKMLPLARKEMDKERLVELAQEMREMRTDLEAQDKDRLRRIALPVRRGTKQQKAMH